MSELEAASHTNELEPLDGKEVHLHLDHRMAGVGGDTSWTRSIYPDYFVAPGRHCWSVVLHPLVGVMADSPPTLPADLLCRITSQLEQAYTPLQSSRARARSMLGAAGAVLLLALALALLLRFYP